MIIGALAFADRLEALVNLLQMSCNLASRVRADSIYPCQGGPLRHCVAYFAHDFFAPSASTSALPITSTQGTIFSTVSQGKAMDQPFCESAASTGLKLNRIGDRLDASLSAGRVGLTTGTAGYADGAKHSATAFDHQTTTGG